MCVSSKSTWRNKLSDDKILVLVAHTVMYLPFPLQRLAILLVDRPMKCPLRTGGFACSIVTEYLLGERGMIAKSLRLFCARTVFSLSILFQRGKSEVLESYIRKRYTAHVIMRAVLLALHDIFGFGFGLWKRLLNIKFYCFMRYYND